MKHWVLALVVLAGCVGAPVVPEAKGEFKATGSVHYGGRGAAFNSARVVAPYLNMARHTDDSWSGKMFDVPFDCTVKGDVVRGGEKFFMQRKRSDFDGTVLIEGVISDHRFTFEVSNDSIRSHTQRVDAKFTGPEKTGRHKLTLHGGGGALVVEGEATKMADLAWPQMGFALIATFDW